MPNFPVLSGESQARIYSPTRMQMPRFSISLAMVLALSAVSTSMQAAEGIVFDSAKTFAANFRTSLKTGEKKWRWNESEKSIKIAPVASGVYIYDRTPSDSSEETHTTFSVSAANKFTVRIPFSMGTAKSSLGIYIIDPEYENRGYLALYNINNSGADDLIRFVTNAMPATGGAGGMEKAENFYSPGIDINERGTLVFTYSIAEKGMGTMTLAILNAKGEQVHFAGYEMANIRKPLKTFEVGFRFAVQNGQGDYTLYGFAPSIAAAD